jgi:SpoVK/Ycf46/Vps4 family AAA+-type ATPase
MQEALKMARSDLILALSAAALEGDAEHARRAIETIAAEELRKGHTHVSDRLSELLLAAPFSERPSTPIVETGLAPGRATRKSLHTKNLKDVMLGAESATLLREVIQEQRHIRGLRALGMEPRHRLLLVGPPGTGKTSLASALAGELGIPFRTVQYESVIGSFLGETSARLRDMFASVSEEPCVLFLDEFDTLAKERGDEHDAGEVKRVVSTLLLQLDALPSHIVLVAATNHDELLDRAAWRRFQVTLRLPLPVAEERAELARQLAARIGIGKPEFVEAAAASMEGKSYAAVEEYVFSVRRKEIVDSLEQ